MREPAVAGQFYPAAAEDLKNNLTSLIGRRSKTDEVKAMIMPHAGYIYSGRVAGATIAAANLKSHYVILGPNHTGMGAEFSLASQEDWRTPLGLAKVDKPLGESLLSGSRIFKEDTSAHTFEHSIEVILPFLQYFLADNFSFLPIIIRSSQLDKLKKAGEELAMTVKKTPAALATIIIASSDMTHFESQELANAKDKEAIGAVLNLDADGLYRKIKEMDISMCGFAPAIIMLTAAKLLGASRAQLVKYETSAETSGDYDSVVGYAGIIIS
ncbi:MAG: AmmeMemoRadiSam system protein B [Candidatus Omnitrophota bacterium]